MHPACCVQILSPEALLYCLGIWNECDSQLMHASMATETRSDAERLTESTHKRDGPAIAHYCNKKMLLLPLTRLLRRKIA